LTGARAEAEDLCQDICLALPAKLGSYQRRAKVTTWLYRVAVNAAHDRRRKSATYAKAITGWGDWENARQAEIVEMHKRHKSWTSAKAQSVGEFQRPKRPFAK